MAFVDPFAGSGFSTTATPQGAYLPHLSASRLSALPYGCQTAVGLMGDMINTLEAVIAAPMALLHRIEALARDVINTADNAVNGLIDDTFNTLDVFDEMIPDFNGPTFPDILNELMNCPFIADSPLGAGIAGMLDQIDEFGEILEMPSDFVQEMNKSAQGMVTDALGAVEDAAIGKLDALEDMYESMLDNLGVFEVLDFMADLQACIESLCQAADDAAALYEETTDKLRVARDESGNWKQVVRDRMESVSEESKASLAATKDKLTALKDRAADTRIIPGVVA